MDSENHDAFHMDVDKLIDVEREVNKVAIF
jgi:hypothetical protein